MLHYVIYKFGVSNALDWHFTLRYFTIKSIFITLPPIIIDPILLKNIDTNRNEWVKWNEPLYVYDQKHHPFMPYSMYIYDHFNATLIMIEKT